MANILLVHVGTDDREMYAEYLRFKGYTVVEASTTDAAIPALHGCDVLVTGLLVPGTIPPAELIRRAKADRGVRPLPVVVVTACAVETKHEEATQAGADVVLLKPCLPEDLAATVARALGIATC